MGILDDVTGAASGMMGGVMNTVLGMTDLDEKAIALFEEHAGAGRFATLKTMLADGKITKEEIAAEVGPIAEKAGISPMMVSGLMMLLGNK